MSTITTINRIFDRLAKVEKRVGRLDRTEDVDRASARAYRNAALSHTSSGQWQKITLDAENWDVFGEFTGGTFTAKVAGKYQVNGHVRFSANATGTRIVGIFVNGTLRAEGGGEAGTAQISSLSVSDILALAVGDTVELWAYQNSGGNLAYAVSSIWTYMSIQLLA